MISISNAANTLAEMRATHRIVEQLAEEARPTDLVTAYQIQNVLVERLLSQHGGQRIGYKAACTNTLAQQQLNVPGPLFGQMLSFSHFQSPATLPANNFTRRIIEAEFGIQIAADLPARSTPYDASSVVDYIATVMPGIEIVSHRFVDWSKAGAPSIAADNAIHGAWVQGTPTADWRALDLANHEVTLTVNDKLFDQGSGANVLGHPFNVVAWLANELPHHSKQLKAGDFITTGVVMNVYPAQAGDKVVADFGVLGKVEVVFI
ncbi:MAG: fumarylacetoacetate hydrolase family protein [Caldilineaceae bacterium]